MSTSNEFEKGDLQTALGHALALLSRDPALAQEQVSEILKVYPDTPKAKRILASAWRMQKKPQKGLDILTPMMGDFLDSPDFLHEIAQCYGAAGLGSDAIKSLRRAVKLDPKHAPSWQSLGHQLKVAGDEPGSKQAFENHFALSTQHPELVEAVKLLREGKLGKAERIVRELSKNTPPMYLPSGCSLTSVSRLDNSKTPGTCWNVAWTWHLTFTRHVIVMHWF